MIEYPKYAYTASVSLVLAHNLISSHSASVQGHFLDELMTDLACLLPWYAARFRIVPWFIWSVLSPLLSTSPPAPISAPDFTLTLAYIVLAIFCMLPRSSIISSAPLICSSFMYSVFDILPVYHTTNSCMVPIKACMLWYVRPSVRILPLYPTPSILSHFSLLASFSLHRLSTCSLAGKLLGNFSSTLTLPPPSIAQP